MVETTKMDDDNNDLNDAEDRNAKVQNLMMTGFLNFWYEKSRMIWH